MNDPAVESVTAAAYTLPTDAPEADGTLAWDSVTLVLAQVRAGGEQGIGWTYGSPACAAVISGMLAGVVHGRPALDVPGTSEAMIRAARKKGGWAPLCTPSPPAPAGLAVLCYHSCTSAFQVMPGDGDKQR